MKFLKRLKVTKSLSAETSADENREAIVEEIKEKYKIPSEEIHPLLQEEIEEQIRLMEGVHRLEQQQQQRRRRKRRIRGRNA